MFLCRRCHDDKAGCIHFTGSFGPCENCHCTGQCVNCRHIKQKGYRYRGRRTHAKRRWRQRQQRQRQEGRQ